MALSTSSRSEKVLIIGLSGPSSSGKTTLARLLRQVFNVSVVASPVDDESASQTAALPSGSGSVVTNGDASTTSTNSRKISSSQVRWTIKLFILHEDDFYKTDKLIPRKEFTSEAHGTRTLEDWDCIEAIDLPLLSSTLRHINQHGVLPPEMVSKEDQNTVGESGVSDSAVEGLRADLVDWVSTLPRRRQQQQQPDQESGTTSVSDEEVVITICVLDGFLLYPSPNSPVGSEEREMLDMMNESLDAKLFIPSTRAQTIDRRTKRTGYVTLEGFWEDPPGYVEDVVWMNYRKENEWLFEDIKAHSEIRNGDIGDDEQQTHKGENQRSEKWRTVDEGRVDRKVADANGISVGPGTGEVHLRDILPWAIDRLKQTIQNKVA